VRLFADQPLGRAFPTPRFSPEGKTVAWEITVGPTRRQSVSHGVIQAASGGDVTLLPDTYRVVTWRDDGAAVLAGSD
jgi:hypothetical protein